MPLARLSQDDVFRLVIPVPETYVNYIHIGQPVEVSVPTLGRVFPGKVARSSSDLDPQTRTLHTEVDVPNPGHVLLAGMYAPAAIQLDHRPDALAVPLQAVTRQGDTASVLVVNESGRVEERQVRLGLQTEAAVEVLSGLAADTLVVTGDRGALKPGQPVRAQLVAPLQYPAGQQH
jgi:RND family efflux transporter MFP subunit